jgi:hypothetical protein
MMQQMTGMVATMMFMREDKKRQPSFDKKVCKLPHQVAFLLVRYVSKKEINEEEFDVSNKDSMMLLPSALGHTLVLLSHKPYYYYYLHLLTNFCIFIVEVATKQTHTHIAAKILGSHNPPSLLAAKTNKQTNTHTSKSEKGFSDGKKKKKKKAKF